VPAGGTVVGTFNDGSPAAVENTFGKGKAVYVGACPAIAYAKEAKFVPDRLAEKWPALLRGFITSLAQQRGVPRLVRLSHPVVEAGIYDAEGGTAVVLANFTYEPIRGLGVTIPVGRPVKSVRSVEKGPLKFTVTARPASAQAAGPFDRDVTLRLDLGLTDIVLVE